MTNLSPDLIHGVDCLDYSDNFVCARNECDNMVI